MSLIKIFSGNTYTSENTDLAILVIKVRYRGEEYIKFKGKLFNKYNGIEYEHRNYKVYYNNITHWKRLDNERF